MIRIMLVEDHTVVREALRSMLEKEPDMRIVAEAGDGETALRLSGEIAPEVVVMDVSMPGLDGIETTRRLLAANPAIKVLALSTYRDRRIIQQILDCGAAGYVVKSAAGAELRRGIRAVVEGRSYLSSEAAEAVADGLRSSQPGPELALSRRERQVLALIVGGKTSSDIADSLHIAQSTVEVHRRNIMRKLQVHGMANLIKYAIREGLTPP
jgi:two-component system NarL family response regulator